jgi:hypothetical protein
LVYPPVIEDDAVVPDASSAVTVAGRQLGWRMNPYCTGDVVNDPEPSVIEVTETDVHCALDVIVTVTGLLGPNPVPLTVINGTPLYAP